MSADFVALVCPNCGGKLDVYHDVDRFACSHCSSQVIVKRRGGTVSLSAVTDAISRVQVGTDTAAWELSLRRLTEERDAATKNRTTTVLSLTTSLLWLWVFGAFTGCSVVGMSTEGPAVFVVLALLGGFAVLALVNRRSRLKTQVLDLDSQIAGMNKKIATLRSQLDDV